MKLLLRIAANFAIVYLLDVYFPQYFVVFGGIPAFIILALLLTIMNMALRPILNAIAFPLHFFVSILATILVNAAFLWVTYRVTLAMDPNVIALTIVGGVAGWFVVSTILGVTNWVLKKVL